MAFFFLILFITFLGWSIYGLVHAKRSLAEAERVRARMDDAVWTRIHDAPATGRIVVSGEAGSSGAALVEAPFTGGDALWARARLQTNVGSVVREWTESVDEIVIDDGSGRVARVSASDVRVRLPERSVGAGNSERIARYLTRQGWTDNSESSQFEYESVLRPGDTVSVMGRVAAPNAGYRDSDGALRFATSDEILLFDSAAEPSAPAEARRKVGCAIFGIVVFALAIAVTILQLIAD